ncbi:uncharacterized protein STEHIDRAFT_163958 [Stereum hirsutum FP-91666 SS1]|uniref:Uncharacterized protein n=1 Tax=Stereum hirsutum (strain FP-91666) TaxID=721885 RepID=R7RVM7_STEHR|nr:uncharacterized protein STEHIDRAFT_163958 [Stereum hirsutum FP-91666 SS1]EIM79134.1 hypothetical protein STEHIDRAFT_163958 [Stereum hirsutum FP-91666 SS1]
MTHLLFVSCSTYIVHANSLDNSRASTKGMAMEEGLTKGTAATEEQNDGSGESLSISSAAANSLVSTSSSISATSLSSQSDIVAICVTCGPSSSISNLVIITSPPARIIHCIPECDIVFGGPNILIEPSHQDSESEMWPVRREHERPSAEVLAAKGGLHEFGTPADV